MLVLDDDPHERQLAVTVLSASGEFEATPVGDAIVFGEALAKGAFDAVVLESKLRWADAAAVLEAVKRSGRQRAVILFTPPGNDEAVIAAFRRGLDESVPKTPKGFVELQSIVRAVLQRLTAAEGAVETGLGRLLERLDRAVFQADLDGRLIDANRTFTELLGFAQRSDALRANVFDLCLPSAIRDDVIGRLREQRFVREPSLTLHAIDGTPLTVSVALSLVVDERRGRVVTGLLETVAAPAVQAAPLESLGGRAMVVAHDLKEPLRTLVRSSEQLRMRYAGQLDPEADEQLGFLHDAARRLQGQVKKLFEPTPAPSVGAVESAQKQALSGDPINDQSSDLAVAGTDAGAVLALALEYLRAAIETDGARVTSDPLPSVAVAPDALLQLLQNLVGNALKFRRDEPARVHVSAERRDEQWCFSISDNGVGIAPEHAERIFGMFDRGGASPRTSGTGIGLAVCRRLVERHGGRIWVHSQPGEGATFFFTLPAAAPLRAAAPLPLRPRRADGR